MHNSLEFSNRAYECVTRAHVRAVLHKNARNAYAAENIATHPALQLDSKSQLHWTVIINRMCSIVRVKMSTRR